LGNLKEQDHVEKVGWKDVDWIHLAQGVDQCPALVDTVMNLVFYIKGREFLD
jgi:hypothetical protein